MIGKSIGAVALVLIVGVVLLSGCIGQPQKEYVCPDGGTVSDPKLCFNSTSSPTVTQTPTITPTAPVIISTAVSSNDFKEIRTLRGHAGYVKTVAWSPDGTKIASGSVDWTIKIWDASSGSALKALSHGGSVYSVAWSPYGTKIASASSDGIIKIWDAASGSELGSSQYSEAETVAWSLDGTKFGFRGHDASYSGTAHIIDTSSGTERTYSINCCVDSTFALSPDGKKFAVGSNGAVQIRDASSGSLLKTLSGHGATLRSIAWSPDGTEIASASSDGIIKIWDASSESLRRTLSTVVYGNSSIGWGVNTVAWSPDSTKIASASDDWAIRIWDESSGALLTTLSGHGSAVNSVAWSPDGTKIASGSNDETIKIWGSA
jgi:WD40 repeat protein